MKTEREKNTELGMIVLIGIGTLGFMFPMMARWFLVGLIALGVRSYMRK